MMDPLTLVTTVDVLAALALIALGAIADSLIHHGVNRILPANATFHRIWDFIFQPMLRAAIVVGFVLVAYPALYGATVAPELHALLAAGQSRIAVIMNVAYLVSLVAPALPFMRSHLGAAVPVQGIVAVAMVFTWYTGYLGITSASIWPGWLSAGIVLAMSVLAHRLAIDIGGLVGHHVDEALHTRGFHELVPHSVEIVLQAPVLLYYGLVLGRQIGI